jgi:uncharacterized heparinase superfamily protein
MSAHEFRWRAQDAMHTAAERLRAALRLRWDRNDLRQCLAPPTLQSCSRHLERGDWRAAHTALSAAILARPSRFVLDPSAAPMLRGKVLSRWPGAQHDAAARADRILDGRYDLLGYRDVQWTRDGRVDWQYDPIHERRPPRSFYADVRFLDAAIGDHKIIWELNRHQHWLQLGRAAWLTGDAKYAAAIADQLQTWLSDNPPYVGINWASMLEIGFRAISWTWALHALLAMDVGNSPWLVDMLVALDRQLTHVERHLSYYFSPNTHLTGEALALYVVGTALPELSASARWAETGRRVLLDEIDRQILDDGGHAERSMHYQRYTLDFYLLATRTARLAGDADAAQRFEAAALRLAEFTRMCADGAGRLPLIGDDDGGMLWPIGGRACDDVRDSLAVAAVVLDRPELAAWGIPEEALWIAGPGSAPQSTTAEPRSRLFGTTGYFVARGRDGSHAIFDVGAHGYLNGGHAHADALSLALSLDGRRLLIDPGTSTYTMDAAVRDRMRTTANHNTVTVDHRSQSLPAGPFHWGSTADAHVTGWRSNRSFDVIEATHNGYAAARHRRIVVRSADCGWLVVDVISGGTTTRHAAAHWHFDPAWQLTPDGQRVRARHESGDAVWMVCGGGDITLLRGAADGVGWCAPVYGQLVPTSSLRLEAERQGPFAFVTWLDTSRSFSSPSLRCTETYDGEEAVVTAEIVDGSRVAAFLVRTHGVDAGVLHRVGSFATDATMLHYAADGDDLRSMSVVGGRQVTAACDGWPSLAAETSIADLHVTVRGAEILFESDHAPVNLAVRGAGRWTTARANGRDLPLSAKRPTDRLLIHDSDWPPFSCGNVAADESAHFGAAFADR